MWGDDVRAARERAGLSQSELARRSKVSRKQLILIEQNHNASLETLSKLVPHLPFLQLSFGTRTLDAREHLADPKDVDEALRSIRSAEREIAKARTVLERPGSAEKTGRVLAFEPDRKLAITLAEEEQIDRLQSAITAAGDRSMVSYRTSYRADPSRYSKPRKGRAAAGHGAVAEDSPEVKVRQIPEHYWEKLGVRDTVVMDGDSLSDLGFVDHDLLFVRALKAKEPEDDDIVVCRVGSTDADTEVLVKVYWKDGDRRWLLSANKEKVDKYPPRQIKKGDRFDVLGIVEGRSGYGLPGSLAPRPRKGNRS